MATETKPTVSASVRVATSLRSRIATGEWRAGEVIPSRRALAAEYGVAAATMERAAGMLIADGILDASDRRGTFVAGRPPAPTAAPLSTSQSAKAGGALQATVGIVASVVLYDSPATRAAQWTARIVAELEHTLASDTGVTQRFLNLVQGVDKPDLSLQQGVEQLLADGVDAIVIVEEGDPAVEALAAAAGVPLVSATFDRIAGSTMHHVYIDSMIGGALAARHLRDRGYENLTFLLPFTSVWAEDRLAGARSAVGPDGIHVFPASAEPPNTEEWVRVGRNVGRELLRAGLAPGTGVIAPNDSVALGVMAVAREQGLEPGRDYGLVGFDDFYRDAHLTSLVPPLAQFGREAAGMALRLLRGEDCPAHIALQHRLIARASTQSMVIP